LLGEIETENENLWGFNLYQTKEIEHESLINIKPRIGNKGILIENQDILEKVNKLVFK